MKSIRQLKWADKKLDENVHRKAFFFVKRQYFFLLILVTAISGRPKPELCFLPGWLRWTLLPKECYGDPLSGCVVDWTPNPWEADTLPLSYCRIHSTFTSCIIVTMLGKQCKMKLPSNEWAWKVIDGREEAKKRKITWHAIWTHLTSKLLLWMKVIFARKTFL